MYELSKIRIFLIVSYPASSIKEEFGYRNSPSEALLYSTFRFRLGGQAQGRVVSVSNYWWVLSVTSHHWARDGEESGGWGQIRTQVITVCLGLVWMLPRQWHTHLLVMDLYSDETVMLLALKIIISEENFESKIINHFFLIPCFWSSYDVGDKFA